MTRIQSVFPRDVLYELASVGALPLPQASPQGGTKRERDSDNATPASRSSSMSKDSHRTIAGSRRITRETHSHSHSQPQPQHPNQPQPQPSQSQSQSQPQPSQSYNLPVYSNDLGRLPLHGQVNFQADGCPGSSHPGSTHSSNTWFSSLSSGTQQPAYPTPTPAPAPITGHNFTHGDAYSIDNLFLDQISSPFGDLSAQPAHPPAGSQSGTNELQAFMDMSMPMVHTNEMNGMLDTDPDTIAMWSSAPTGFGCVFSVLACAIFVLSLVDSRGGLLRINDWGAYLSSVSGVASVNLDGSTGSGSHGQGA